MSPLWLFTDGDTARFEALFNCEAEPSKGTAWFTPR
jgi:hypothetical protein